MLQDIIEKRKKRVLKVFQCLPIYLIRTTWPWKNEITLKKMQIWRKLTNFYIQTSRYNDCFFLKPLFFLVIILSSWNASLSAVCFNARHFDVVDFISGKLVCFSSTNIALSTSALKSYMVLWNFDIYFINVSINNS